VPKRSKREVVPVPEVGGTLSRKDLLRMLEKMDKPELHRFIKENKIKTAVISPFSTKEEWIKDIMFHIYGVTDDYTVSPAARRKNKELGLEGGSVFGHRMGSRKAVMDRRIHEGVLIEDLVEELLTKFDTIKDARHARREITKHLFYLPKRRRISIIWTLTPDSKKNHVIGVFDPMGSGQKKDAHINRLKRKIEKK